MTNQKDIAKKQAEIVGQLQQFPIGRTNSGGRAGGMVEVVVTNPLPGQPRVVQAKCANDCPPGEVQLLRADDGSYVALSRSAAQKTSETTTRQVSRKNPTIPKKDKEIWPCTVAFLYSRIKPNQENLRDNFATDKTSWDVGVAGFSGTTPANLFFQRPDDLGDYETANDALTNNLKASRSLATGLTPDAASSAADDGDWGAGSADAIRVWFHIGNPAHIESIATTTRILNVTGTPMHPLAASIQNDGPGYCLVTKIFSTFYKAMFPSEPMGAGPMTKELKKQFPGLGGKIGYFGEISKWRGLTDYITGSTPVSYFKLDPRGEEPYRVPTSFPPSYNPGTDMPPHQQQHAAWYQFGWGTDSSPIQIGSYSSSAVHVVPSVADSTGCGNTISADSWWWGGYSTPYFAILDRLANDAYEEIYVCWEGNRNNIGLAQSFFEAFKTYWGILGSVTQLASCGRYGCAVPAPGGGSNYPPAPVTNIPRFLVEALGRKAEIWLKVCEGDKLPVELKLPFEFAAVVEKFQVLGNASLGVANGPTLTSLLLTYGSSYTSPWYQFYLENPHATLSIDKEFAYVNISYGGERIWEEPLPFSIPTMLSNLGAGSARANFYRTLGRIDGNFAIVGGFIGTNNLTVKNRPKQIKDCFKYVQTFKIQLPTKNNKNLVIVASQRYTRGEIITLTANSPDTEFDQKYLIFDFRTNKLEDIPPPPGVSTSMTKAPWQNPNADYAGFGGLPALIQFHIPGYEVPAEIVKTYMPKFYKPKNTWTDLDWLHFQLQESPRVFSPLSEVLPPNVFLAVNANTGTSDNVIFDLDGKFGRGGRAEKISNPSSFGDFNGINSQTYSNSFVNRSFPLLISFKEQLIGNGLIKDGKLFKWYKVSTSSFPIDGQAKRNLPIYN